MGILFSRVSLEVSVLSNGLYLNRGIGSPYTREKKGLQNYSNIWKLNYNCFCVFDALLCNRRRVKTHHDVNERLQKKFV